MSAAAFRWCRLRPRPTRRRSCRGLWDFCHALLGDGLSHGDYLERLTYLPFLKVADE